MAKLKMAFKFLLLSICAFISVVILTTKNCTKFKIKADLTGFEISGSFDPR